MTRTPSRNRTATRTLRQCVFVAPIILGTVFSVTYAAGQGLETTNDLGLRVTQDDIITAIQEQSEFWPPVRKYVASEKLDHVADTATRTEAVAFLKSVHDELHGRLMGEDEKRAMDLVTYLGHRLRTFAIYRQIRDVVNNEAAMVVLVHHWDTSQRSLLALPEAKRLVESAKVVAGMRQQMTDLGLSDDVVSRAMPLWKKQSECLTLMLSTEAGQQMAKFDAEVRKKRPAVSRLIRRVHASAEWASIAQTDTSDLIDRDDFVKAWETLERYDVARTAAATR